MIGFGAKAIMKKNKRHKRQRRQRARTQRRRSARVAAKRAARPRLASIIPTDGSEPHLFDDCPICRAMKETGVAPDASGVVEMTAEQRARYEQRLEEIVAEDGWPEDTRWISGDQLRRDFEEINATLEANGYPTDTDAMDEEELDAHMVRVMEVIAARASADRDRATGAGCN